VVQHLIASRVNARWRHALWLVVLLRLAMPVAPSSSWSIFNLLPAPPGLPMRMGVALEMTPAPPPIAFGAHQATIAMLPAPRWLVVWKWIAAVWIAGAAVLLLRALIATVRINLAIRSAAEGGGAPLRIIDEARDRLGIARRVRVVETNAVKTPALHGLWRPTLLLPAGLT